ncbi:RICIN domain-containing protein [Halosimplex amylolyticum]|uniref:RICIN domain-containing protein n=1 Tax=Halosimplex amylolyticum TaxID=3396616 RepID=UPI003F578003
MGKRRTTSRRAALGLIGSGALVVASRTFAATNLSVSRPADMSVVSDPNAYLGIDGIGTSPGDEISVVNNTDATLEVTVTTSNFRIESGGSDTEWTFQLAAGSSQTVQFSPDGANSDDVQFEGDLLDGSTETGRIEFSRTIEIPPEDGQTYRIENVHSGLSLGAVFAWEINNGVEIYYNVEQETYDGSNDQQWIVRENGDGTLRFENVRYGDVIGVRDGSSGQGATLTLRNWNGNDDRRWDPTLNDDGSYRFENEASGLAMDVEGESTAPGGDVIQWPWKGSTAIPNQKWLLVPL